MHLYKINLGTGSLLLVLILDEHKRPELLQGFSPVWYI